MKNMLLLGIKIFELENISKLCERWKQVEKEGYTNGLKVANQLFDAGGGLVVTVYDVE
ncbi:MAG: hypothetical protein QM426_02540 [Euryarchaeota archaeon]|nr:hypothetical protein [Euryarchaeota archaeon]